MSEVFRRSDRLGFWGREIPVCGLAIWWILYRLHAHDLTGALLLGVVVGVILTICNIWMSRR